MNAVEIVLSVLAEMRGNEFDDPHLDAEGLVAARKLARNWADRIEDGLKRLMQRCDMEIAEIRADYEKRMDEQATMFIRRGEFLEKSCMYLHDRLAHELSLRLPERIVLHLPIPLPVPGEEGKGVPR